ncbi:MerR family transcriptional regulator [Amycolatopsis sp. FDAARGOS 1241]|nr:MerR family transcriptional regulator [Amycolatopsis sp. FDAARGOS 1241]
MTGDTLGIGDLARRTGVPVRTIRFYCDEGLLEPTRSTGGHRRFDASAVDRLTLVRRMRSLGLGLGSITDVLSGRRSLDDAVAAERASLDREVATLAWRRSVLRAVESGPDRLEVLSAVSDGFAARDVLVRLWRPMTMAPIPAHTAEMFLTISAPEPPEVPTPEQVVAYAELVLLATDQSFVRSLRSSTLVDHERIRDLAALHAEVADACALAFADVAAGSPPVPGAALDRFVAAHASALGAADSPAFRRALNHRTAPDRDPRVRRYWHLAGTITGEPAPMGVTHTWLLDALHRSTSQPVPDLGHSR